jgi:hypothetical protein
MKMLDAKALARPHDRTGVVGLKDVLQNHLQAGSPGGKYLFHAGALGGRHKLQEMLNEGVRCARGKVGQGW